MSVSVPPPRFLSLKWKIILSLSLVLVISNAAIVMFTDSRAQEQFRIEQRQSMQTLFQALNKQLEASNANLGRVASLVSLLDAEQLPAGADLRQRLRHVLDLHSATLELEWDISMVRFVDSSTLNAFPAPNPDDLAEVLYQLARQAQTGGSQAAALVCQPECYQYIATPLIDQSGSGVLLVGRSIADLVLEFHRIHDARLAFLVPPRQGPDASLVERWQLDVAAVSGAQQGLPLLQAFANHFSTRQLAEAPRLMRYEGDWYLGQLATGRADNNLRMMIFPVSDAMHKLQGNRQTTIVISLAGLLLAESLMLLFLWQPMKRLRSLVSVLPGLGGCSDDGVGELPNPRKGAYLVNDEVDLLANSISELGQNLEASCRARDEAEQHLLWLANHDPLTNLYNRRYFQQQLEQMLGRALRYQRHGALLYLDLDQFKNVNDLSGHRTGDSLLQQVAALLRKNVRDTDLLARLGGDEFAVLIPEGDQEAAEATAKKILQRLKSLTISDESHTHRVSASIGIALFPRHGANVGDLLANADLAMYQAKEAGRNRYYLFSASDQAREYLGLRTRFQEKINRALEHGGFFLQYQPVLNIREEEVVRHEVLIRMRDEDGTVVPPDRFINVAEQTGQIREIDRWVVQQALESLQEQPALRLAVNLSGAVIVDPQMQAWLRENLPKAGLRPGQLVLELTETAMVSNIVGAVELMRDMHSLGAEFALDDFGSGFASYAYLKQLPVDYVKIDGSFIQGLATSEDDQLFVKALVEVAHGLGKQVVAEYVEDAQTLDILEHYGVDFGQGYYIGRPGSDLVQQVPFRPPGNAV